MTALNDFVCGLPVFPAQHFSPLALKVFVDGKEMFNFKKDYGCTSV